MVWIMQSGYPILGSVFHCDEHEKTVREAWDVNNLKFSFRRTIDMRVMNQWLKVVQIASSLEFSDEQDAII
jgi:hypothetical protein